jgi:hypothetical protein
MTLNDLQNKILAEIDKTGFPLKLRLSKYINDEGYLVASKEYYVNFDEGKGRELDLRELRN